MTFNCNQCGACCKVLPILVAPDLVDEDGHCRHLKDNKCTIYENRPDICNHDKMFALFDMTKEEYDEMSMQACIQLKAVADELN
jgi:Fe-S-cluster containining protein